MQLHKARILLTGAAGGIGQQLAQHLADKGAYLALIGRRGPSLAQVRDAVAAKQRNVIAVTADISRADGAAHAVDQVVREWGGVDILINNAGLSHFGELATTDATLLEAVVRTNVLGPMLLSRAVLPTMLQQHSGQIVNVGSIFGSIGFAFFAPYSATKYALRGFSEALRRELHGTGVGVTYVAPRATKTPFNTDAVYQMASAVKMNMDEPDAVAQQIVRAIETDKRDCYLGFPETLFVRLNGLLPRWVDGALRKQNRVMRKFAQNT
jgi:short-subunit dehydrogenase